MSVRTKHLSGMVIRERSTQGRGPALWSPTGADGDRQYLWPGRGAGLFLIDADGIAPVTHPAASGHYSELKQARGALARLLAGRAAHATASRPRRAAGISRGPAALRGQSRSAGCQPAIRQSGKPAATCLTPGQLTASPRRGRLRPGTPMPGTRSQPARTCGKPRPRTRARVLITPPRNRMAADTVQRSRLAAPAEPAEHQPSRWPVPAATPGIVRAAVL